MLVINLHVRGLEVTFVIPSHLFMVRASIDATMSAVVADAVDGVVIHDGLVVNVNIGDGHVVHAAVVIEPAVTPIATFITIAEVSESVVYAAVEADVRPPVSGMPDVEAVTPSPVARRPEIARFRREHPGARHPVVAVGTVSPVAGSPDIAIAWASRLHVNRQRRRADPY